MSKKNDLLKYLNLLFEAKAELTGDPVAPIRYHGYEWEGGMRLELLDLELAVCPMMAETAVRGQRSFMIWKMLSERVLELEEVFSPRKDGTLHRYLRITRGDELVQFKQLDADTREMINRFVLVQRESYLRYARCFCSEPAVLPSVFTLSLDDMELGELLACFYRSGIVRCLTGDMAEKEFIRFFCRVWNLPLNPDYYSLISKSLARPHPTALIERLRTSLEDHIEKLDARRW